MAFDHARARDEMAAYLYMSIAPRRGIYLGNDLARCDKKSRRHRIAQLSLPASSISLGELISRQNRARNWRPWREAKAIPAASAADAAYDSKIRTTRRRAVRRPRPRLIASGGYRHGIPRRHNACHHHFMPRSECVVTAPASGRYAFAAATVYLSATPIGPFERWFRQLSHEVSNNQPDSELAAIK